MRLATMTSIAILAISSAALAQVAGTPVEQKPLPSNAAPAAKDNDMPLDNAAPVTTNTPLANGVSDMAPVPAPARTPRRR